MPRSDNPNPNPNTSAGRRAAAQDDATAGYVDRRREILGAAAQVFKSRGLRGATFSHVAELMGTDRASLYYYFSNKEEMFQELVSEAMRENLAAAEKIRGEDAPAPEKLRRLMEGLMASYGETYPVLYVLIQENLSHVSPEQADWAEDMKRINRRYERILIDIIERGQREGTLRDSAPAWILAYGVLGVFGWTNRWFNPAETPATAQDIGRAFADALLDGLTA
ncbi:MAG TPA: TetR/AcrR family transcriptional regulator [Solirubrobacteraceae bacterium]|nr:TetR/AcrR family transcriptional regulator [Solirubrobacteraceae bacterium]